MVSHLVNDALGQVFNTVPQYICSIGPYTIGMWVVSLKADNVFANIGVILNAELVIDKASNEMFFKHLARLFTAKAHIGPACMLLKRKVGTLQQIRNPTNAAFSERDFKIFVF